jgi:hypothetical protein
MKKLVFFIFLIVNFVSQAQQWEWAIQEDVKHLAVDAKGNVFTHKDSVIKRFNTIGVLKWQLNCTGQMSVTSMAADNKGNLYLSANFTDFYINSSHFVSAGYNDIFFCKIDSMSHLVWYKVTGGVNDEYSGDLFVDVNQKILFCGTAGAGATIGSTNFSEDGLFAGRYDANGNLEMLIHHSGGEASEIAADTSGNIFVSGFVENSDTLELGNNNTLYGTQYSGASREYLAKFNSFGTVIWAKYIRSDFYSSYRNLGVDKNGNSYLTKWQRYDGFDLMKTDHTGNEEWINHYTSVYGGCGGLCTDHNDKVWLAGSLGYYPNISHMPFIWKVEPSDSTAMTVASKVYSEGMQIVNDADNNIYISGTFNDTAEFGSTTLTSSHGFFLAKMKGEGSTLNNVKEILAGNFTVFPNPSTGKVKITCSDESKSYSVKVYNANAQIVKHHTSGNEIDLSAQPKGIYFVQILSGEKRSTQKIILE